MNRTQKGAWFGLAAPCFCIGVWFWIASQIPGPNFIWTVLFFPIATSAMFLALMFIVIRKTHRLGEVATDERDKLIRGKALLASFVWLLLMLPGLAGIMVGLSDDEGMVNAFMMIPLSVLILFITLGIYSAAMLVQYKVGGVKTYE